MGKKEKENGIRKEESYCDEQNEKGNRSVKTMDYKEQERN